MNTPVLVTRVRPVANNSFIVELLSERKVHTQTPNGYINTRLQKVFAWQAVDADTLNSLGLKMADSNLTEDSNGNPVYDVSLQRVDFTQVIPGKIFIEETLIPRKYEGRIVGQPKRQPTQNGSPMPVLAVSGNPIYRYSNFTLDLEKRDIILQHNSQMSFDEYQASYAIAKNAVLAPTE